MLFGGTGRLLHASFNGKTPTLQIGGKFGLQFSQTLTRINFVGVESPVLCDRHMEKVHMRPLFIHVNHCGNDILRAHKLRKKGFALLKESPGVLWRKALKKGAAGGNDKPAHTHGVLSHCFGQLKSVNAALNGLGIVCRRGFVQFVIR